MITISSQTCMLRGMSSWCNVHIHLETLGKGSKKLDFDGQADKSGHAAVWNGGCEGHSHRTLGVAHLNPDLLHYVQLFQGQWMLWVIDGANQIEDLARVDAVWNLLVLLAGGHRSLPRALIDERVSVLQEAAPHPTAAHHRETAAGRRRRALPLRPKHFRGTAG